MKAYRFLGTHTDIGGYAALDHFGQRVELPAELAKDAVRGGASLLPEDQFEALGFSAEELSKHGTPGGRINAPDSFLRKHKAGLLAAHEYRESLTKAGADVQPEGEAKTVGKAGK